MKTIDGFNINEMNKTYYMFKISFYDETKEPKYYKSFKRAYNAVCKEIKNENWCSLIGYGFGGVKKELGCC